MKAAEIITAGKTLLNTQVGRLIYNAITPKRLALAAALIAGGYILKRVIGHTPPLKPSVQKVKK